MNVRPIGTGDEASWLQLRTALWPGSRDEHAVEIARFFAGKSREPLAVLLATDEKGQVLGFAELSIRPYAEGCKTDNVAFLEGWFVVPETRGCGVGRALVNAGEAWARSLGCSEFASNSEVDNEASIAAHRALGFEEVEVIRCFRKDLTPASAG